MTAGERLIWAAVYAQHYLTGTTQAIGHRTTTQRAADAAVTATYALRALAMAHETGPIQGEAHSDAEEMLR